MELWQERTALLLGEEGLARLEASTVIVVGVGGVGAYAAEMVTRAGVGRIVLVDSDVVGDSNRNRQLVALSSTIGQSKVSILSARLQDINPKLDVICIQEYLTPENIPSILSSALKKEEAGVSTDSVSDGLKACCSGRKHMDACSKDPRDPRTDAGLFVIDAIDTLAPKLALIDYCVKNGIAHVSSMGSGAKFDITKVRIADISKSFNCPLAYIVRKRLRREYGISKGFKVVFSEELPEREAIIAEEGRNKKSNVGTISYMPAVFGCACAQVCILFLTKNS